MLWRRGEARDDVEDGEVAGAIEVLLVHRPRYDDWSFPKGKCDPGETLLEAAVREVNEETALQVDVGEGLGRVRYVDHKDRTKVVGYWAMTVTGGDFEPNDEVDEIAWVPAATARRRLSYPHDEPLLDQLLASRQPSDP